MENNRGKNNVEENLRVERGLQIYLVLDRVGDFAPERVLESLVGFHIGSLDGEVQRHGVGGQAGVVFRVVCENLHVEYMGRAPRVANDSPHDQS